MSATRVSSRDKGPGPIRFLRPADHRPGLWARDTGDIGLCRVPPTSARPYRVDLLLCGHHFRLSQWTLAAAGAVVRVLPGRRTADNALALL